LIPFIQVRTISPKQKDHYIYITDKGTHTAILLSYNKDWKEFFPKETLPEGKFAGIEFSWGDKDFFEQIPTWDKLTWKVALDALFWPDKGLMHIELLEKIPRVKAIPISNEQYKALRTFIQDSFKKDSEGKVIVRPGLTYSGTDRFFDSNETYYFLNTCNTWTAKGLRKAGLPAPVWTPHVWGIYFHL